MTILTRDTVLELKSDTFDDEEYTVTGYAAVYNNIDDYNDVIKPNAFKSVQASDIKLLFNHNKDEIIGTIVELKSTEYGLWFKAKFMPFISKSLEVYNLLKSKAINGVSIGYKAIDYLLNGSVRELTDIKLYEISIVTFPANELAVVTDVKSAVTPVEPTETAVETAVETVEESVDDIADAVEEMHDAIDRYNDLLDKVSKLYNELLSIYKPKN